MKWREKYSKIYTIQKTNNLIDLYMYINNENINIRRNLRY